jgi:hypothetical protein
MPNVGTRNDPKRRIQQRKRTCLIASPVASLQKDETMEAKKRDEDKKGMF